MAEQLAFITTIATNPYNGQASSTDCLKINEKNIRFGITWRKAPMAAAVIPGIRILHLAGW